jgi:hypothetical protein
MTPDNSYSLLLGFFLVVIVTQKQFSAWVLEMLLKLSRSGATIALLGTLMLAYHNSLHYTFLVLAIIVVFLLKDMWTRWPTSDARRLALEIGRDQDRFDHSSSIDLQMADKTIVHAAPPKFHKNDASLLVFPPSEATLRELSG